MLLEADMHMAHVMRTALSTTHLTEASGWRRCSCSCAPARCSTCSWRTWSRRGPCRRLRYLQQGHFSLADNCHMFRQFSKPSTFHLHSLLFLKLQVLRNIIAFCSEDKIITMNCTSCIMTVILITKLKAQTFIVSSSSST